MATKSGCFSCWGKRLKDETVGNGASRGVNRGSGCLNDDDDPWAASFSEEDVSAAEADVLLFMLLSLWRRDSCGV